MLEFIEHAFENPLFVVGIILILGHYISLIFARIKLPEVTGYIIAGLLFGDSVLGIISIDMMVKLGPVTEIALGLIALSIGGEFLWSKIRRLGIHMIVITLLQVFLAFVVVLVTLMLFQLSLAIALLLGAIAAATAPAATVAIVQSLRIKGEFVDYLYGVVALDDAFTIVLFGIVGAVAGGVAHGMDSNALLDAGSEIMFSLLLGGMGGLILHFVCYKIRDNGILSIIAGGMTLLVSGIALTFHLSALLSTMFMGAILINLARRNSRIFQSLHPFTPPIYALFFILAGSSLDPRIFGQGQILLLGFVYLTSRAVGKYGGVFLGSAVTKSPPAIRKWLGLCMLPQGGVELGLLIVVQNSIAPLIPEIATNLQLMTNVVLFSIFINGIIGPPLSRLALIRGSK